LHERENAAQAGGVPAEYLQLIVPPVGQITHRLGPVLNAKIYLFSPPPNQFYKGASRPA
jgi:hypothetical protein